MSPRSLPLRRPALRSRTRFEFAPLLRYALELSGRRAAPLCVLDTAGGDQRWFQAFFAEAGRPPA